MLNRFVSAWFILFAYLLSIVFQYGSAKTESNLLEKLAYKYGTDKSKDDHNYVDVYATLFHHRQQVHNVTEIGIAAGQSIQMWHEYFPQAQIYGFDMFIDPQVQANLNHLSRYHSFIGPDCGRPNVGRSIPFKSESMDIIIEDASHQFSLSESILKNFWRYLKPGGFYVIEDVDPQRGGFKVKVAPEKLRPFTRAVLSNNHAYFIDTHINHRNWTYWSQVQGTNWTKDHTIHNSYLLVIRKRIGRVPPFQMHQGSVAMRSDKIVKADNNNLRH